MAGARARRVHHPGLGVRRARPRAHRLRQPATARLPHRRRAAAARPGAAGGRRADRSYGVWRRGRAGGCSRGAGLAGPPGLGLQGRCGTLLGSLCVRAAQSVREHRALAVCRSRFTHVSGPGLVTLLWESPGLSYACAHSVLNAFRTGIRTGRSGVGAGSLRACTGRLNGHRAAQVACVPAP